MTGPLPYTPRPPRFLVGSRVTLKVRAEFAGTTHVPAGSEGEVLFADYVFAWGAYRYHVRFDPTPTLPSGMHLTGLPAWKLEAEEAEHLHTPEPGVGPEGETRVWEPVCVDCHVALRAEYDVDGHVDWEAC